MPSTGTGEWGILGKGQLHQNTSLVSECAAELGRIIPPGPGWPRFTAGSCGSKQCDRTGRAICAVPTWHLQTLRLSQATERSTSLMSSLSLLLRCFTSYQGLIPSAAAHSIPWLWSNHARGAKPAAQPSSLGCPVLAFLPQDCPLDKAPLPAGVQQASVQLLTLLPKNQWGLCISQQLLVNSRDLWDPKSCPGGFPGMGDKVNGWRKREAAG